MQVFFIRHGTSMCNKKGIINGQRIDDSLLSSNDENLVLTSVQLMDKNIKVLYSSDLLRAKQTAQIINSKISVPLITDVRLREVDFGTLSGKSWIDIESTSSNSLRNEYVQSNYSFIDYEGETSKNVESRIRAFIDDLKKKYDNESSVAAVTHGGIIRMINFLYGGRILSKVENGSITILNV